MTEPTTLLPTDSAERKNIPITSGVLDYFPAAIAEVAFVSFVGNEKHNPGEPLHHARGKSMDHADCIARHLVERGTIDVVRLADGREFKVRHTAYVAWRALALLQEELEAAGAPLARGAWLSDNSGMTRQDDRPTEVRDGGTTRDDVPQSCREAPAPRPAPREDEQPLPQRDSRLLVQRSDGRLLDRVQMGGDAPALQRDPAQPVAAPIRLAERTKD